MKGIDESTPRSLFELCRPIIGTEDDDTESLSSVAVSLLYSRLSDVTDHITQMFPLSRMYQAVNLRIESILVNSAIRD